MAPDRLGGVEVRPVEEADRPWIAELCRRCFRSEVVAVLGHLHRPALLPALVAWAKGERAGALAYREDERGAEVVLLAADPPGRGAGGALLGALEEVGRRLGWERLWLVVTNDNTPALRLYQRRGWEVAALHAGAVERDRLLKPDIPLHGVDGIPIRHLLELRRTLDAGGPER